GAGGAGGGGDQEQWRRQTRTLVQTRHVPVATSEEVQRAVERATAHAAEAQATDQGTRNSKQESTEPGEWIADEAEVAREVAGVEEERFSRVTFVPLDAWLEPYMTPSQYQKMVVEEVVSRRPVTRWEKQFEKTGGRWVERAVRAGAQGPVKQPPNTPGPVRGSIPPAAIPAPPPLAPVKRSYIDEPAAAPRVEGPAHTQYAGDLFAETGRYARLAMAVARGEKFGVVHAHDWMTFEAAMAVASASGKPLVLQIHSTELDRAGAAANARIMEIERQGMMAADRVIAVSYKTKTQLIEKYGIDPQKIEVVYNATDAVPPPPAEKAPLRKKQKTVLFLGRLTQQKGPDYFLRAAQKVLSVEPDVKFVVAGKGDLLDDLKELAAELGIKKKVVFTGFLKKDPVQKAFRAADVYVMPSLSEPFGIAPLEALAHDVPVIISKQSGVAEVLRHVLKVDFWDTEDLANKILAVLRHPSLAQTLRERGNLEVRQLSWDDSARRIAEVYEELAGIKVPA
ncbi:MAG TPA: glycosyltransferase family 4 protein, partial [Phycisphaerae bacterium]|nr:glycosyltransferase family 4 protein [Phycisphaerae bacterium]